MVRGVKRCCLRDLVQRRLRAQDATWRTRQYGRTIREMILATRRRAASLVACALTAACAADHGPRAQRDTPDATLPSEDAPDATPQSDAFASAPDAGPYSAEHRCFVHDDCNDGMYNDYSHARCPASPPTSGTACDLSADAQCFYCADGVGALHWDSPIPLHRCEQGIWRAETVDYTCA
jgi:hypothetical protein